MDKAVSISFITAIFPVLAILMVQQESLTRNRHGHSFFVGGEGERELEQQPSCFLMGSGGKRGGGGTAESERGGKERTGEEEEDTSKS